MSISRRRTQIVQDDLGPVRRGSRRGPPPGSRQRGLILLGAVLAASLIFGGLVVALLHSRSASSLAAQTSPASRVVVFVVDGLAPQWMTAANMPTVVNLSHNGTSYQQAWIGQLESTAAPSAASIGTGIFPGQNGVPGSEWQDASTRLVVHGTLPDQVLLGSLDQVMESKGVSSVTAELKSKHPTARVLAVGGTNCAAPDAAATWLADYILCIAKDARRWVPHSVAGHALPAAVLSALPASWKIARGPGLSAAVEGWRLGQQDRIVTRMAVDALKHVHPTLTYVDFPEFGAVAPYVPPAQQGGTFRGLLRGIDSGIASIIATLRKQGSVKGTSFVVTSGEAVSPADQSVPKSALVSGIVAAGGQQVYIDGSGLATIGLQDVLQAQPVAQAIEGQHRNPIDALYFRNGSGSAMSYSPEYLNPLLPRRYTDSIAYLLSTLVSSIAPHVVVAYAPHTMTGTAPLQHHARFSSIGGAAWDTQHIPLVLSGHGIVSGISAYPARLVDVAPTVEALLGLGHPSGPGVVLADALSQSSQGDIDAQTRAQRTLSPIVSALRARVTGSGQ